MMKNVEFYTFEDQIWYRAEDGSQRQLTESDHDAIRFIIEKFREFYPEALEAALNEYKRCQANIHCGCASATSVSSMLAFRI